MFSLSEQAQHVKDVHMFLEAIIYVLLLFSFLYNFYTLGIKKVSVKNVTKS